jgi:hypothetical protein
MWVGLRNRVWGGKSFNIRKWGARVGLAKEVTEMQKRWAVSRGEGDLMGGPEFFSSLHALQPLLSEVIPLNARIRMSELAGL